jgi:nucleotide-binding universal stress UspA family protein
MRDRTAVLRTVGVGYDGSPEAEAALAFGQALALSAGAELHVRAIVDDRVPTVLRSSLAGLVKVHWSDATMAEHELLERGLTAALDGVARVSSEVASGNPVARLLEFSRGLDLLVIGSRRWGTAARVLLGSTGAAILHDAACPVLAVPRPAVS